MVYSDIHFVDENMQLTSFRTWCTSDSSLTVQKHFNVNERNGPIDSIQKVLRKEAGKSEVHCVHFSDKR